MTQQNPRDSATSGTRSARRGARVCWLSTAAALACCQASAGFLGCGSLRLWVGVFGWASSSHILDFCFKLFFGTLFFSHIRFIYYYLILGRKYTANMPWLDSPGPANFGPNPR
jgi:hypothetical protein